MSLEKLKKKRCLSRVMFHYTKSHITRDIQILNELNIPARSLEVEPPLINAFSTTSGYRHIRYSPSKFIDIQGVRYAVLMRIADGFWTHGARKVFLGHSDFSDDERNQLNLMDYSSEVLKEDIYVDSNDKFIPFFALRTVYIEYPEVNPPEIFCCIKNGGRIWELLDT